MKYGLQILTLTLTFSIFTQAEQRTEITDFESHLTAAIEACENLKTGDKCELTLSTGVEKGSCIWDTGLDGEYVNACITKR